MRTGLPGTVYGSGLGVAQPLQSITAIGHVYTVGGCTQYGSYVGNGSHFGLNERYSVYKRDTSTGYDYAVVEDYGCKLIQTYPHDVGTARTNPSPVNQNPAAAAPETALPGVSKTEVYVVGALALGTVLYLAFHREG